MGKHGKHHRVYFTDDESPSEERQVVFPFPFLFFDSRWLSLSILGKAFETAFARVTKFRPRELRICWGKPGPWRVQYRFGGWKWKWGIAPTSTSVFFINAYCLHCVLCRAVLKYQIILFPDYSVWFCLHGYRNTLIVFSELFCTFFT